MISTESFVAGFAYGGTTVLVGQPMDTLKTLQQTSASSRSLAGTASELYRTAGLRGFYRGGLPLLLGGGLMRSAQFGVYSSAMATIQSNYGPADPSSQYWFGCVNPQVVAAGFCGGIGRGLVEGPFEMAKVRNQVVSGWRFGDAFQGFGTTMFRNSLLFAGFVIYMDVLKQQLDQRDMKWTPFITAGLCANAAWATIWPLDVVKTRRQSGRYDGRNVLWLLRDALRKGDMYRGMGVGLARSFIANGASMEVYAVVERELKGRI